MSAVRKYYGAIPVERKGLKLTRKVFFTQFKKRQENLDR